MNVIDFLPRITESERACYEFLRCLTRAQKNRIVVDDALQIWNAAVKWTRRNGSKAPVRKKRQSRGKNQNPKV